MSKDSLKLAEYTIDSCSLMEIFDDSSWVSKKVTPGLWLRISELISEGIIISHMEVLLEIKKEDGKGEELYEWAQNNRHIFKAHDEYAEGKVIRSMSEKFKDFVNGKINSVHADPWLVAQARRGGLKIISEEFFSNSPNPKNWAIPNVCIDPVFGVKCVNLLELTKERNWTFK